jgi:hypothetical protein
MSSIQQIIQESINQNPIGLKEALQEELRQRIALALEAKMSEGIEEEFDEDESFDLSDYAAEELEETNTSGGYSKKHIEQGLELYRDEMKQGAFSSEAESIVANDARKKFGFSQDKAEKFAKYVSDFHVASSYAKGPRSSLDKENIHGALKRKFRK